MPIVRGASFESHVFSMGKGRSCSEGDSRGGEMLTFCEIGLATWPNYIL